MPLRIRSDGCGTQHYADFNNDTADHRVHSAKHITTYAVNIPANYNHKVNERWSLIIDYQGNVGTPWGQYADFQYYLNPQGSKYLVVYPQGYESHWQGASYAIKGVDDLQFTSDLLVSRCGLYFCNFHGKYSLIKVIR